MFVGKQALTVGPHRQTFLSLILIFIGDIATLIDFFSFTVWIFYILAMFVLLLLRKTRPDAHRPYRVNKFQITLDKRIVGHLPGGLVCCFQAPLLAPIIVIFVGTYLVIAPIVTAPAMEYLYVAGVMALGVLVYIPFVYYKCSLQCLGK